MLKGLISCFKQFFDVEAVDRFSAVVVAFHPQFKLRWLGCLSQTTHNNVLSAIKEAMAAVYDSIDDQYVKLNENFDDFFDFTCTSNPQNINQGFGTSNSEIIFQKFSVETRSDLELLNLYPSIKKVFIRFNTPLPSSAAVERLFSYASMFNVPKFNRLNDETFEIRVLMKCNASADKKSSF